MKLPSRKLDHTKGYKYFNQIGEWLYEEDKRHKSFIFDTTNPYFKAFERLYFVEYDNVHNVDLLVFRFAPNGMWSTFWVDRKMWIFCPLETLQEKLVRSTHKNLYPKLMEKYGLCYGFFN